MVEAIPLGRPFPLRITVSGVEPRGTVAVTIIGVAGIEPAAGFVQVMADDSGTAILETTATVAFQGHVSLVVGADVGGHIVTDSVDFVFDSPGARLAAQSVGAGGNVGRQITVEEYYASIPRTSDPNYVIGYEAGGDGIATANATAELSTTILVDDIRYARTDGSFTEPVSAIEYFLPDTGGGVPLPGEVEGVPPGNHVGTASTLDDVTPQANCGSTSTYVEFRQRIDNVPYPMPQSTYVRAVDYNGWSIPDHILAEGYIGAGGRFTFNLANCDTSSWFDNSAPDVYFIIETRTDNGLTASHGTFARRHWWRTGTYFNQTAAALQGSTITIAGANAEAQNTQRIWHKVHQVRDWERAATGVTFPVDILYPAADYWGVAKASRAAIGQMQIIREDAVFDRTLFHEFGHLAYYRKMLGAAQYNSDHACNLSGSCVSFPACGGCVGHEWNKDIGPEAAMIEGWADFFEAVTTRSITNVVPAWVHIDNPNLWKPSYTIANGPGVEIWVAAYLWDLWDSPVGSSTDGDPISPVGNPQQRYSSVANYFVNMPLSAELRHVWIQRIKPTLNSTGLSQHQTVLAINTLGSVY